MRRECRSGLNRPGNRGVEVVGCEVEVHHHLLRTEFRRPDRRPILRRTLDLDLETVRRLQLRPTTGRALDDRPTEKLLVERSQIESRAGNVSIEHRTPKSNAWSLHSAQIARPSVEMRARGCWVADGDALAQGTSRIVRVRRRTRSSDLSKHGAARLMRRHCPEAPKGRQLWGSSRTCSSIQACIWASTP